MIDNNSFVLKYINKTKAAEQLIHFKTGLNIIYGESGVGKSELIKCMANNNIFDSDYYAIHVDKNNDDVQIVLQNPDLQIVSNSIKNELAFNFECNYNDSSYIRKELDDIIDNLFFDIDLDRHPVTLSGGEKELLNIFTALSLRPKVILIDDALSFLSDRMKSQVISLFAKYDDTVIMWFTSDNKDLEYSTARFEIAEKGFTDIESIPQSDFPTNKIKTGLVNLNIRNLDFSYNSYEPIFNKLNKHIEKFRCLGITGENGSGKTTLAALLLNIEKPKSGSIDLTLDDTDLEIGFLDQFPERLLGVMTILEFVEQLVASEKFNINDLPLIKNDLKSQGISWDEVRNKSSLELSWTTLRFILVCILANCKYDLLILDEPTFGMGQQQRINFRSYFIRYLAKKHLILISHDKLFLNSLCDSMINL